MVVYIWESNSSLSLNDVFKLHQLERRIKWGSSKNDLSVVSACVLFSAKLYGVAEEVLATKADFICV